MPLVTLVYVMANLAYFAVVPIQLMKESPAVAVVRNIPHSRPLLDVVFAINMGRTPWYFTADSICIPRIKLQEM